MKINGIIITIPLMSEMEVGQTGFLTTDAIIVVNKKLVFIATGFSISDIKEGRYLIPIKRIGPGEEDYEIDFYIAYDFYNKELDEEAIQKIKKNKKFLGPYEVPTETKQQLNYQKQLYPRMDIVELMNEFISIKKILMLNPDDIFCIDDEKAIRKLLKEKIEKFSLNELKDYENTFKPLSEEESEGGRIINYLEDTSMADFISKRIKEIKASEKMTGMSPQELEEIRIEAEENEDVDLLIEIEKEKKNREKK